MAATSQYTLTHKEVLELIVKHLNLHDGHWMIGLNFSFGPGNFGPEPNSMSPGVAIGVNGFTLTRVDPSLLSADPIIRPPPSLVADAAAVNPVGAKVEQSRRQSKGRNLVLDD
jgi:hypothetical protein